MRNVLWLQMLPAAGLEMECKSNVSCESHNSCESGTSCISGVSRGEPITTEVS